VGLGVGIQIRSLSQLPKSLLRAAAR